MAWNLNSDRPIYTQVLEEIQIRIIIGQYKAGERIPSVRELAEQAGVNPNTMQKALTELERSGLVMSQRTSGRIVTGDLELLRQTRNKLAYDQINAFIERMKKLGFEKEEVMALLKQAEGEKNE